jgi:pimeloyl-ACP methyl ester carboxylesterase
LVFGPDENLVATLTPPAGGPVAPRFAVLLTNVGINPRCGPYRLNVEVARRFAQLGIPSLRFDLSGLGDSARGSGTLSPSQQWVLDTRAAMDEAERELGIREFVMIGVCSGADIAYLTAPVDPRLRGVVLFDPYLYPTVRTVVRGVLYRLHAQGLATTARLALRRLARLARQRFTSRKSVTADGESTLRYGPTAPSLDEFAGRIGSIVDGGARVLFLYSGSYPYYYNYESQVLDNLRPYGLHDKVETGFLREADHVLMGMAGRRRFIERCVSATSRWFGTPEGDTPKVL